MKLNKRIIMCAIFVFLLVPATVFGSGTVKIGGSQTLTINWSDVAVTHTVQSSGGKVHLKVTNVEYDNFYRVWLYEADENNPDDPVNEFPRYGYGDTEFIWDVSDFVDGDNGKAELYAHISYAEKTDVVKIQFYD